MWSVPTSLLFNNYWHQLWTVILVAWWSHMASDGNLGSGHGLLPDSTKSLRESMLTLPIAFPKSFKEIIWKCLQRAAVWHRLLHRSNIHLVEDYSSSLLVLHIGWTGLASVEGLSPVQRQGITWTNAGLLSVGLVGKKIWNSNGDFIIFIQENSFQFVVCQNVVHFVQGEMI